MAVNRDKGIIIYGTDEDRKKLAAMASVSDQSGSEFLIELLRSRYRTLFGETDPDCIIMQR